MCGWVDTSLIHPILTIRRSHMSCTLDTREQPQSELRIRSPHFPYLFEQSRTSAPLSTDRNGGRHYPITNMITSISTVIVIRASMKIQNHPSLQTGSCGGEPEMSLDKVPAGYWFSVGVENGRRKHKWGDRMGSRGLAA